MADVRCPMCGKLNPAEAEICRFCQARLKPLASGASGGKSAGPSSSQPASPSGAGKPQPPAEPTPPASASDQDSTDWLRGLLGPNADAPEPAEDSSETPAEPAEEADAPQGGDEALAPNWLSRIRQRKTEETDAVSRIGPKPQLEDGESQPPQAEDNNWLSGLTGQENVSSSDAGDVASWLASLRDSEEPESPSQPPPPPSKTPAPATPSKPSQFETEDDEWLRSLTGRIQGDAPTNDEPTSPQAGTPKVQPGAPRPGVESPARSGRYSPEISGGNVPPSTGDEIPDWLRDLEPDQPETPAPPQPVAGNEVPDWLKQLGSVAQQPAEAEPAEVPDWLKDLQPPSPQEPSGNAAPTDSTSASSGGNTLASSEGETLASSEGELPDWLRNFPTDQSAQPAAPADEIPDWMGHFAAEPPASEPQPPAETSASSDKILAPSEADIPEWLRDMHSNQPAVGETPSEPAAANPQEELPSWLRDFHTDQQPPEAASPELSATPQEELPDWLKDLQGAEDSTTPGAETQEPLARPAEFGQFGQSTAESTPPAAGEPPQAALPAGEPPDWLSQFSANAQEDSAAPAEPTPEETAAEANIPDWLSDFRGIPAATAAGLPPMDGAGQFGETSGNSGDFSMQEDAGRPSTAPSAGEASNSSASDTSASSGEQTPDWLKDFESVPPLSQASEQVLSSSDDSVRDWLNSLNTNDAPQAGTGSALEGIAPEDLAPAEIPDWLKSVRDQAPSQQAQPPAAPAQPPSGSASPFGEESLPDWMNAQPPAEAGWETSPAAETSHQPFASHEMNEMLSGVPTDAGTASENAAESGGEELEPAQLPNWLQAMRPVESAVADISPASAVDEQRVEKSGPLAGLRGVLPGEDMVAQYRKPPVYTNKLQVSEKQHLHASLLESILSDESKAQPAAGESIRASQIILRVLVAVLLVVLVLVPSLTGFRLPVPTGLEANQPGLSSVFQTINNLPSGANVLLVADYEAGLSGELSTAALPVLTHLQTRQPKVLIASTVPSGPVLGEALLSAASTTPVANLGYIAGGTNALRMLAQPASALNPSPLQSLVPFPYGHNWNELGLKNLKDITSFQVILVVTDSLENARGWIEQVQPGLGPQTSLLLISSAQVAPLVQTYWESRQVGGVVSGMAGGAAYQQLTSQPGLAGSSWTALQLTLAAMIVLMIGGALAAGVTSLFSRGKSKRKV